jgi:hypothetical protein
MKKTTKVALATAIVVGGAVGTFSTWKAARISSTIPLMVDETEQIKSRKEAQEKACAAQADSITKRYFAGLTYLSPQSVNLACQGKVSAIADSFRVKESELAAATANCDSASSAAKTGWAIALMAAVASLVAFFRKKKGGANGN